jgi:hypothetical protein
LGEDPRLAEVAGHLCGHGGGVLQDRYDEVFRLFRF